MAKYILKRDLPFTKAGSPILQVDGYAPLPSTLIFYVERDDESKVFVELGDKDTLLQEGWIEEVKPREWMVVYRNAVLEAIYGLENWQKGNIRKGYDSREFEIIKVREVID